MHKAQIAREKFLKHHQARELLKGVGAFVKLRPPLKCVKGILQGTQITLGLTI